MEYNEQNLRTLHAQGLSFTQIAIQLGVTRSVISGKVSRLGLSRRSLLAKAETNVATRPARYVEPTKAELREMLRQAVENTK